MADRGAQLAITSSLPEDFVKVGGDTYTPFVYVPVNYGENLTFPECTGTGGTPPPTEGQLWPRGKS